MASTMDTDEQLEEDDDETSQNSLTSSDFDLMKVYKKIYEIFLNVFNSIYRNKESVVSLKLGMKRYLLKKYV